MKKNKKYWKNVAKNYERDYWEAEYTIALLEDQINVLRENRKDYEYLDKQYMEALDKYEAQSAALESVKRELKILRQHNIGKKPHYTTTTGTSTAKYGNWAIKNYNIPVGIDPAIKRAIKEAPELPGTDKKRWWRRSR